MLKTKLIQWEEKERRKEDELARNKQLEIEKKEAQEKEKAARDKEKREWIISHGSQYLRDCLELDVSANLEYVVERAEKEHPGYTVDYADQAYWEEKFSPSTPALAELKRLRANGVEAAIVWLKAPALVRLDDEDDCYGDFEPCEAIVIRNYLGKYDLIKVI